MLSIAHAHHYHKHHQILHLKHALDIIKLTMHNPIYKTNLRLLAQISCTLAGMMCLIVPWLDFVWRIVVSLRIC